ncbi:hypothetical protein CASFOL_012787 [Castilleja foliolosa]|uniref:F-box domain-containing protein n=1 Tax=Castilleja foliolosa TaxID=1961234 RepID=A0ABD3DLE8_9LAMI
MEDLISQLPDDILVSIITRIPTKDALSTTILSKRWRYLFRFVPTLDFSWPRDRSTYPEKKSIEGLYGVLQRHRAFIRSFEFHWRLTEPYTHTFEQCIYLLGKLGIKKLSFEPITNQFSFSLHLLSQMQSLEHLSLSLCSLQPNLSIICNSLKTLKLSDVKVPPGSLECILSNCVSLCSFTIIDCKFSSNLCFRGPNLQLKCIAIHDCEGFEQIELFASNLTTLEYCDYNLVTFMFDYVPRLESVYLYAHEATPFVCTRLGKDLPHLKTLVWDISGDPFFEVLSAGTRAGTLGLASGLRLITLHCTEVYIHLTK